MWSSFEKHFPWLNLSHAHVLHVGTAMALQILMGMEGFFLAPADEDGAGVCSSWPHAQPGFCITGGSALLDLVEPGSMKRSYPGPAIQI